MSKLPDIDIDFADSKSACAAIGGISAMLVKQDGKRVGHASGVYLQDIPVDPITGLASLEYNSAEQHGFTKLDLLNQSIYREVRDEEHLLALMNAPPPWELLDEEAFVSQLAQVGQHYDVVSHIMPKSIEELAIVIALIRPAKRHLIGQPMQDIKEEIWKASTDSYAFKHAHAISYATLICVQMNLLAEKLLSGEDECIVFTEG